MRGSKPPLSCRVEAVFLSVNLLLSLVIPILFLVLRRIKWIPGFALPGAISTIFMVTKQIGELLKAQLTCLSNSFILR